MIRTAKEHAYFLCFFACLFLFFLWPVVALQKGFMHGDYGLQFYPWSFLYAQGLKAGHLPYWTDLVACGFPIVAEGQMGAYYPFNFLFFWALPFKLAYALSVPFHLLAGGVGFYCYGRKIGLSNPAAALSALLFSFSSAYGGCFYNLVTLRVLTWLPWAMWVLEHLSRVRQVYRTFLWICILSVLFFLMWTGGFPQMAVYAFFYLLILAGLGSTLPMRRLVFVLTAVALGALLALPQIVPTLELIKHSVRAGEGVDFALWGSVFPPSAVSLLYPEWGGLLRVTFYIGIAPLYLFILSFLRKKRAVEKTHLWLVLLFFLLAMGKYNPLYAWVVENFSLTIARNPSKFLFFSSVSVAIVAGFGLDACLRPENVFTMRDRAKKLLVILAVAVTLLPALSGWLFHLFEQRFIDYGYRYADRVFAGKQDPMKSLENYRGMIDQLVEQLGRALVWWQPGNLATIVFSVISVPVLLGFFYRPALKNIWTFFLFAVVAADLALFGVSFGTGFVGNLRPLSVVESGAMTARHLKDLQLRHGGRLVESPSSHLDGELLEPSLNMLYGIRHAGGYSPLLIQRYYELTKELGIVDASLGKYPFSQRAWEERLGILDAVGAKIVIADRQMPFQSWKLSEILNGLSIYENISALPAVWGVYDWKILPGKDERLAYLKTKAFKPEREAVLEQPTETDGRSVLGITPRVDILAKTVFGVEAEVDASQKAMVIFGNAHYPHWKAEVDGISKSLLLVNHAFSGVFVEKGRHRVKFSYDTNFHHRLELASALAWGLLLIATFVAWQGKEKQS